MLQISAKMSEFVILENMPLTGKSEVVEKETHIVNITYEAGFFHFKADFSYVESF